MKEAFWWKASWDGDEDRRSDSLMGAAVEVGEAEAETLLWLLVAVVALLKKRFLRMLELREMLPRFGGRCMGG